MELNIDKPAAKCKGVDLRPAVSLAFTVCELINFFTLMISPVLHASNNSRSGSFVIITSKFTDKVLLRLDMVIDVYRLYWYSNQSNENTETFNFLSSPTSNWFCSLSHWIPPSQSSAKLATDESFNRNTFVQNINWTIYDCFVVLCVWLGSPP